MLNLHQAEQGVTLIELVIGLVIVAILIASGAPSFSQWIANTQIRTAAESIQNGLQMARVEAVKNNANVRFSLTDAGGAVVWNFACPAVAAGCANTAAIQSKVAGEGGVRAKAGVSTTAGTDYTVALTAGTALPAGVTFNGFGQVLLANVSAGTDITRVDTTNPSVGSSRRMVVTVSPGGQIRMCDPAQSGMTPPDPRGC